MNHKALTHYYEDLKLWAALDEIDREEAKKKKAST